MQHKFILTVDASKHDHIKGAWQSSISIYVGDWYSSAGTVYECILAHTSAGGNAPPNVTYWTPAVLAGTSLGSVVWKGAWSGITTYAAGDGVIEGGLAYVSIQGTNLNHQPPNTSWWAPITYSVGDVVGPGSAVSANIVEFDGASGKLIKDGALTHANVADAISKKHTQGTDVGLDAVGSNPVTAAQLKLVMAQAQRNTDQTIPATTVTGVVCNNELVDTHNAFSTVTGKFTVPVAGYYRITQLWRLESAAWTAGNELSVPVLVNDAEVGKTFGTNMQASFTNIFMFGGSFVTGWLAVGATIQSGIFSSIQVVVDGSAFAAFNYLCIERIPGA